MTNGARIIGFGNPERGDDAAGLLVARRLRELGVATTEESGDLLSLIEGRPDDDEVIIIDAVVTGANPGTIKMWDVGDSTSSFAASEISTHGLGVAQAIELNRTLNRLPRRIRIYGIEGRRFKIGAQPSAEVMAAVESLARLIRRGVPPWAPLVD